MHLLGYDIVRYLPDLSETAQLARLLAIHNVTTVLDVGANIGEYGQLLREGGYTGKIVSFEPLAKPYDALRQAAADDRNWDVAPRAALGVGAKQVVVNVSANWRSSSILDMLPAHVRAAPESRYVDHQSVRMARLDDLARSYISPDSITFLKIDTQGYEKEVLAGATGILNKVIGLQLEMTLVPLYANQPLYEEMLQYVKALGFEISALFRGFVDRDTGRALQFDMVLFRPQA
jgi:FkbM family methyltransferase